MSRAAAYAATYAADADAADAADDAAAYAADAAATYAADAYAADAAAVTIRDSWLLLAAEIGLQALIELNSPGCEWLWLCNKTGE